MESDRNSRSSSLLGFETHCRLIGIGESRDRYVPVRLESRHLTDSRFCLSRMRSRGIRRRLARVKSRAGGLRTNDSSFSSFVPESLQMRYKRGEKWKAREKAAQTLTLSTDPVFDIPGQPCAFFFFLQQRIRNQLEIMHPSRGSCNDDSFHVNVYALEWAMERARYRSWMPDRYYRLERG